MSVELWKAIFDWATVVLIALTVVSGAGALITGDIINKRQEERLHGFDKELVDAKTELSKQQERAANAELIAGDAKGKAGEAEERAAKANERAAALELEALKLRKELLMQGPRENLLAGDNRQKLVAALKPFAGQKLDVRRSASVFMVNSTVVSSAPIGEDTLGLASALVSIFKDAGWSVPHTPLLAGVTGHGIEIGVQAKASPETMRAANALSAALRNVSLATSGPFILPPDHAKRVGTEVVLPAFDENTIILEVLSRD